MFSLMPGKPVDVNTAQPEGEKEILPKLHDDDLKVELPPCLLQFS